MGHISFLVYADDVNVMDENRNTVKRFIEGKVIQMNQLDATMIY